MQDLFSQLSADTPLVSPPQKRAESSREKTTPWTQEVAEQTCQAFWALPSDHHIRGYALALCKKVYEILKANWDLVDEKLLIAQNLIEAMNLADANKVSELSQSLGRTLRRFVLWIKKRIANLLHHEEQKIDGVPWHGPYYTYNHADSVNGVIFEDSRELELFREHFMTDLFFGQELPFSEQKTTQ